MRPTTMQRTTEHLAQARTGRRRKSAEPPQVSDPPSQATLGQDAGSGSVRTRARERASDARRRAREVVAGAQAARLRTRAVWDERTGGVRP